MKKETERRNGAGGEFINVSVHFVKLIVKLVTRFDDRYAEAIFLKFGVWDIVPKGSIPLLLKKTKFPFNIVYDIGGRKLPCQNPARFVQPFR